MFMHNSCKYLCCIYYYVFQRLVLKVGDTVKADDTVLEIETDKVSMPVQSPQDGKIVQFFVKDGDVVKAGQDLFSVE